MISEMDRDKMMNSVVDMAISITRLNNAMMALNKRMAQMKKMMGGM